MQNTEALHDTTLFGLPTLQGWDDFAAWERWFGENDVRAIVELGTYHGGFSAYLLLVARQKGIPFVTFDATAFEGLDSPAARSLGLRDHFVQADVFGDGKAQVLDVLERDELHPLLLYCDDGDKPREFQTFVPHLRPGDFVAVHDVGTEFYENDVVPLEKYVEPMKFGGSGLTGMWQRVPEPDHVGVAPGDRCVLVVGVGRSGTSATAGCLHRLGVNMGRDLNPADRTNQHGTFEDRELFDATQKVRTEGGGPEIYGPLIAERRATNRIWGIKDPTIVHTIEDILSLLGDVRVVVVERPRARCVNSYMKAYYSGRQAAESFYDEAFQKLEEMLGVLEEKSIPIMRVQFRHLLEDPGEQVGRLVTFAFEGMELPSEDAIREAVDSIKVKERLPVMMGWGNLAIGVRVAKHPEPGFFTDWTALLTGGLRTGDSVLMPRMHMPAHWASNELAADFLKGNKDTLLMLDDDMDFPMDAVHRMRENMANWEYDVVMALAVRRNWQKPSVVVMRSLGETPLPHSLRGDHFEARPRVVLDGQPIEVDAVGLAFTFIRRHVLEAMVNEDWGVDNTYDFFTYGPGKESDDISFCRRCRELGFRMAIDTSVRIGHFCAVPLGWEHWKDWLIEERQADEGNVPIDLTAETLKPILEIAARSDDGVAESARELLEAITDAENQV